MFFQKDEYLHKFEKSADWIESYNISIVDKKNRAFGFADIDYFFSKKKVEYSGTFIVHDTMHKYNNVLPFDGKFEEKIITDKRLEYRVPASKAPIQLNFNDRYLQANLKLTGLFPVYVFPSSITSNEETEIVEEIPLWDRYIQRCRVNGSITLKTGVKKGKRVKVECFGQREHQWGMRRSDKIHFQSRVAIQFRDMLMSVSYIEMDDISMSQAVISRKSGNIPIQNVECEMLNFDKITGELNSSEFSFTDAHDEIDLVVSKKIHSMQMPVPRSKVKRYVRFRNFSDFTIVGTNKKGVGLEEHYLSKEKLKKF